MFLGKKVQKHKKKTQKKRQTTGKHVPPPKQPTKQTANDQKGANTAKQTIEANIVNLKLVVNRAEKNFRLLFLKTNRPIRIFKNKIKKFLLVEN